MKPYLLSVAVLIATATVAYGGYIGGQLTTLWYHMGEVQGRLKCGEDGQ